jgi:hypothetical protein
MSTLVAQTISNGTVSTSSANVIQGSAKAWVRATVSGGVVTVNNSYNILSVTRNSTGIFTFVMTNGMPNANYSVTSIGSSDPTNTYPVWANITPTGIPPTTTQFGVYWFVGGVGLLDPANICVTVTSN